VVAAALPVYGELTGLELRDVAPPRERRRVDVVLRYPDGAQQVLEVDESQHFTGPRAVTLTAYPDQVALGFPHDLWLTCARERTGRERGGFGRPCPPLFPEPGGRNGQRAFRDMLAGAARAQLRAALGHMTDQSPVAAAPLPAHPRRTAGTSTGAHR
jgi:hypothetical protein